MRYLERAFPWLLVAPAVLPVVVWGGVIYPYLVPKTLLFYALGLLSAAAFAVLAAHGRAFYWVRLKSWETWAPGALLALAYIASALGTDFYRSFWSLFVRGDGLLMLTCAVASFYLILLSADKGLFERLARTVAAVATFVALWGILEWLSSGGRIGGLLGNAAFFAGYLGVAFFATLAAARSLSGNWRRTAYAGAALQVVAIALSATRGTMLALALAGVAYLAYLAWQGEGKERARSAGALLALALLGSALFAFRTELAKVPFAPIARIASISTVETDVASRLFIWKNMVTEIGKAPLLGVGAEHIDLLFNRFYDPTLIVEQWFDRSHNAYLDYAAQYGLGGLLLYLALIGGFLAAAARLWRREERLALIAALLALTYAAQSFFVFDTVSSFWLMLAILAALVARSREGDTPDALSFPPAARFASVLFALALALAVIPASVRPALAAYDLSQAYKYQLVDVEQEVGYLSHGIALRTYGDLEYGYEAYDMYAINQAPVLAGQARADAYHAALAVLTANFDRYPYDARTALYLAHVLSLAPEGVPTDGSLLSAALDRSIRLSPKRSQPWYILANLSISNANAHPVGSKERLAGYAAAQDILSKYIELVPALAQPYFVLAQLEYAVGDKAAAAASAATGKELYKSDLETASRAAIYYETALDLPNAAFFLSEVVRLDPADTAAASDLEKIKAYGQQPAR